MIINYSKKILALSLVFMLATVGFPWHYTLAYFNDEEKSEQNFISLGSLDFYLTSAADFDPVITPTQDSYREVTLIDDGTLPFQYRSEINNFGGDSDLCEALDLAVSLAGSPVYNGALADFILATSTDLGAFNFEATLTDTVADLENKTCTFDFVFTGWQDNLPDATAGFFDIETISNVIGGGSYEEPPEDPTPQFGDVVINEIMWMGSIKDDGTGVPNGNGMPNDEWIELRNMTNSVIDIGQWTIENAKASGSTYHVPASRSIPANGYIVIANKPEVSPNTLVAVNIDQPNGNLSFHNTYSSNGQLILKDRNSNVIDSTPIPTSGSWPAGENDTEQRWSMERNSIPGDGTDTNSWHTCDRSSMSDTDLATMKTYWKSNGQDYNCGTPGAVNLSDNDPSIYFNLGSLGGQLISPPEPEQIIEEPVVEDTATYFDLSPQCEEEVCVQGPAEEQITEDTIEEEIIEEPVVEEPTLPTSSVDELDGGQVEEPVVEELVVEEEVIIEEQKEPEPEPEPEPEAEEEETGEL